MNVISQRYLNCIMFKQCAIDIIISWIPIHKMVEKKSIKRDSPTRRTRMECMIVPYSIIMIDSSGSLILVEIVVNELLVEA